MQEKSDNVNYCIDCKYAVPHAAYGVVDKPVLNCEHPKITTRINIVYNTTETWIIRCTDARNEQGLSDVCSCPHYCKASKTRREIMQLLYAIADKSRGEYYWEGTVPYLLKRPELED